MESTEDDSEEQEDLGSSVKGKRGELIVIGELLRRGFEVFTPVVDSGIDCLVKAGEGNYKEIQVKYRENQPNFNVRNFRPREGFIVICYLKGQYDTHLWVIPSKTFYEMSSPIRVRGKEARRLTVGREGSSVYEALRVYESNFNQLLGGATTEVLRAVREATKRIKEPHFKQSDFEGEILTMLATEGRPIGRKEVVDRLSQRFRDEFSDADLQELRSKKPRWEKNARWAITSLNQRGMIEAKTRNQWVITKKGRNVLPKSSVKAR